MEQLGKQMAAATTHRSLRGPQPGVCRSHHTAPSPTEAPSTAATSNHRSPRHRHSHFVNPRVHRHHPAAQVTPHRNTSQHPPTGTSDRKRSSYSDGNTPRCTIATLRPPPPAAAAPTKEARVRVRPPSSRPGSPEAAPRLARLSLGHITPQHGQNISGTESC